MIKVEFKIWYKTVLFLTGEIQPKSRLKNPVES